MFIDARSVDRDKVLEGDLCIVGAGAAGITLAREYINRQVRVILLESGGVVQWLRVDTPGTYTFQVSNPASAMSVDAFAASDMSTPVTPYEGSRLLKPTEGVSPRVVFAADEPFFLRARENRNRAKRP